MNHRPYYDLIPARIRATVNKIKYGVTTPQALVIHLRDFANQVERDVTLDTNHTNQEKLL